MSAEPTSAQERAEWLRLAEEWGQEDPLYTALLRLIADVDAWIATTEQWKVIADERSAVAVTARMEVGHLRADIARLTRERDEWEANEQEQAREVERLTATLAAVRDQVDHTINNPAWTDDLTPAEARLAVAYAIRHVIAPDHGSPDRSIASCCVRLNRDGCPVHGDASPDQERETGGRP